MFNFGWGEIVLIGMVALIAIGPKELPTVLRSVGQMMAKVRRMASEFQGQFQEALREAEIADLKKQAEDLTSSVKDKVTDFTRIDPLAETRNDIEKAFDEPSGATATDPAPVTAVAQEALPAPAEQTADLAKLDIPAPEPLPPVRTEDFLPKQDAPPKDEIRTAEAEPPSADKKAGGVS